MKIWLIAILLGLLTISVVGYPTQKSLFEKRNWEDVSMILASSSIECRIKNIVESYLEGIQNEDTLVEVIQNIKNLLVQRVKSKEIKESNIFIDHDAFVNESIMKMEITFGFYQDEKMKADLILQFKVDFKEE